MLSHEFGGLRPWEMDRLTPDEERSIHARLAALEQQQGVT
jgi:hypothetical protein